MFNWNIACSANSEQFGAFAASSKSRRTPWKSLWEKSKVLILKAYMQVIVIKSVWGPGSCPRGHVSMQKKFLKKAVFSGNSDFNNA